MSETDSVHLDVCELAERLPGRRAVVVEGAEEHLTLLFGGHVAGKQDAGLPEEEGDAAVGVSRGVDDARAQGFEVLVVAPALGAASTRPGRWREGSWNHAEGQAQWACPSVGMCSVRITG
jgi:hypothetical protein